MAWRRSCASRRSTSPACCCTPTLWDRGGCHRRRAAAGGLPASRPGDRLHPRQTGTGDTAARLSCGRTPSFKRDRLSCRSVVARRGSATTGRRRGCRTGSPAGRERRVRRGSPQASRSSARRRPLPAALAGLGVTKAFVCHLDIRRADIQGLAFAHRHTISSLRAGKEKYQDSMRHSQEIGEIFQDG
jgi:hypothetical protein